MSLVSTLIIHTELPTIRKEQFTLPPHKEEEFSLEFEAVELMHHLKYALKVEPETRLLFDNYLQSESFRVAIENGRKTVNVDDVREAYNRIYNQ